VTWNLPNSIDLDETCRSKALSAIYLGRQNMKQKRRRRRGYGKCLMNPQTPDTFFLAPISELLMSTSPWKQCVSESRPNRTCKENQFADFQTKTHI
jgi:hypothetical protein